jgi:hypothetical protein
MHRVAQVIAEHEEQQQAALKQFSAWLTNSLEGLQ